MRPDDPDAARLWDMQDAAIKAVELVKNYTREQYLTDPRTQLAIERLVEIIGEATRGISRQFKTLHPEIPWSAITAQRNVLAHEYGQIDHEEFWKVVTIHIPRLIEQFKPLLPNPPGSPEAQ